MGGDGGCVPQRADMVRTRGFDFARGRAGVQGIAALANAIVYVGEEKVPVKTLRQFRMSHCRLTNEPLQSPVVADRLGTLYNKEQLVTALIQKTIPKDLSYIGKLKDIKDLKVEFADNSKELEKNKIRTAGDGLSDLKGEELGARMMCPIANTEMDDGVCKSLMFWACGCCVSVKGLRMLGVVKGGTSAGSSSSKSEAAAGSSDTTTSGSLNLQSLPKFAKCPVCNADFGSDGSVVIHLAPDQEDIKQNIELLPAKTKEKVSKIIADQKKQKDAETGAGVLGEAKPDSKKRERADGKEDGKDSPSSKKAKLEAPGDKNSKSAVFNSIFRPSEEINRKNRDGFGTGAMARRF